MTQQTQQNEQKLDYVLSLMVEKFLDCRLQTRVFQQGLAKSIDRPRVLIKPHQIWSVHFVLSVCFVRFSFHFARFHSQTHFVFLCFYFFCWQGVKSCDGCKSDPARSCASATTSAELRSIDFSNFCERLSYCAVYFGPTQVIQGTRTSSVPRRGACLASVAAVVVAHCRVEPRMH
jgi:hypothetical protein